MDLHVKNVDPAVVAALDRRAAAHDLSRSEYLRNVLTAGSMEEQYAEQDGRYKRLIDSLIAVVEENTEILKRVAADLERMD